MGKRKTKEAKRGITPEIYFALVAAYLEIGTASHTKAALAVQQQGLRCNYRLARRAYTHGWPEKHSWASPISRVLESSEPIKPQDHTTILRETVAAVVAEQPDVQSVITTPTPPPEDAEVREAERKLVRASRSAAGVLYRALLQILRLAPNIVEKIEADLRDPKLTGARALTMLDKLVRLADRVTDLTAKSMRMERLRLGHAETLIGHQHANISEEEAVAGLREIADLFSSAVAAGGISEDNAPEVIDVTPVSEADPA